MKTAIFYGHSVGNDLGASAHGKNERAENIKIMNSTTKYLREYGMGVYNNVYGDEQAVRTRKAKDFGADSQIEIHHNSAGAGATGVEAYIGETDKSRPLAQALVDEISKATGLPNRGVKRHAPGGYIFGIVREGEALGMMSVLLETRFITNKDDMAISHDVIGKAIATAYAKVYGLNTSTSAPKPEQKPTPTTDIRVGDMVNIKNGAKSYDGESLDSWVYGKQHKVSEISGNRVVLGLDGGIATAFKVTDLTKGGQPVKPQPSKPAPSKPAPQPIPKPTPIAKGTKVIIDQSVKAYTNNALTASNGNFIHGTYYLSTGVLNNGKSYAIGSQANIGNVGGASGWISKTDLEKLLK